MNTEVKGHIKPRSPDRQCGQVQRRHITTNWTLNYQEHLVTSSKCHCDIQRKVYVTEKADPDNQLDTHGKREPHLKN